MRLAFVFLLAACASGPEVRVRAVREDGDVRVAFRRMRYGSAGHPARLDADGGRLDEVVHSPDRLTVSVLWREPAGALRCAFAYGGEAAFAAGGPTSDELVEYVFLEAEGVRVTCVLPRANPVRPVLPLRVQLAAERLPARLAGRGTDQALAAADTVVPLELPRDGDGALVPGDLALRLETASGDPLLFVLGVDADGTPTATTGYVRRYVDGGG